MNEIYIGGKKIELPSINSSISIKDIKGMDLSFKPKYIDLRSTIAICDDQTLLYMKAVFKSLENSIVSSKGADILAYMTLYEQRLRKISSYTLVKDDITNNYLDNTDNELDIEIFSKPEVHQMDDEYFETQFYDDIGDEFGEQFFTTLKTPEKTYTADETNNIIDVEYKEVDDDTEVIGYKKDPSQDNIGSEPKDLLQKLQQINSEGRIFTDEDRIIDKSLNVSNATNLGKIKLGSLNIDSSKKQQINTKNAKVLEMGKVKYGILKNACTSFNEKLHQLNHTIKEYSYKVKAGLICRYNQIQQINIKDSTIAQMPRKLSEKISAGSKTIAKNAIDKTLEASQKIKEQLIKLKESLVNGEYLADGEYIEERKTSKTM